MDVYSGDMLEKCFTVLTWERGNVRGRKGWK